MKKCEDAYFTVEAALVLPMVLAVVVLIMYIMFFQYDRCLMEQDLGILLVRGIAMDAENTEKRVGNLNLLAEQMDQGKYLMWNHGKIGIRQERGGLSVRQEGNLFFPFTGWRLNSEVSSNWKTIREYDNDLLSPTFFVRSCRKVINLWEMEGR
ncbi:MAG: hypothetical protein IJ833_05220 [Lachnospiraceae bacterium]|nr:hypothetical protein [Lachnospiraceae bacterium]